MAIKFGKCINYGDCYLADNRVLQEADEPKFVCSNSVCKAGLVQVRQKEKARFTQRQVYLVGGVMFISLVAVLFLWLGPSAEKQVQQPTLNGGVPMSNSSRKEIPKKTIDQWIEDTKIER